MCAHNCIHSIYQYTGKKKGITGNLSFLLRIDVTSALVEFPWSKSLFLLPFKPRAQSRRVFPVSKPKLRCHNLYGAKQPCWANKLATGIGLGTRLATGVEM